jgi:AraC-like DNA-binding protein
VKTKIVELLPAGGANLKAGATRLYLSERSLSRRLNKADTSFRDLLDETRKDMAIRYIKEQHIALHAIPYLLGYKDYASFFRAFKRWTGKSPPRLRPRGIHPFVHDAAFRRVAVFLPLLLHMDQCTLPGTKQQVLQGRKHEQIVF